VCGSRLSEGAGIVGLAKRAGRGVATVGGLAAAFISGTFVVLSAYATFFVEGAESGGFEMLVLSSVALAAALVFTYMAWPPR
jgi:hypothetical protein